jgi:hypothetical protein
MPSKRDNRLDIDELREQLHNDGQDLGELPGWMFSGSIAYLDLGSIAERNGLGVGEKMGEEVEGSDLRLKLAANTMRFAGGKTMDDLQDKRITHVVVGDDDSRMKGIREQLKWYAVHSYLWCYSIN